MRYYSLVILLLLSTNALADGWKLYSGNMELDVRGSAYLDQSYNFLTISTADPDKPEVRFSCSKQHGLKTTIIFEPSSSRKAPDGNVRYKARRASLDIDGRKPITAIWTHVKETRTIQNREMKTARMLYNAVINNLSFEVREPLSDKVKIEMPPVDDSFEAFANLCHITSKS